MKFRVLILIVAMAVAGACSSDPEPDESASPAESPAAESPSPAGSPAALSPGPSAIASVPATGGIDDPFKLVSPEAAAAHILDAWKKGDKALAAKFADQKVVDALLSRPYTGPDPEFMGCDHEVDHYFCRYRFEASSMTFRVDGGVSAGYHVTELTERAD